MGIPRILLADDHHEILEKVAHLLEGEFEVLAAVENGRRLVVTVLKLDPDVIVMDISMPVLSGIAAACHFKRVCFTGQDDLSYRARRSGSCDGSIFKRGTRIRSQTPACRRPDSGHPRGPARPCVRFPTGQHAVMLLFLLGR
jgi:Response regulator receiver domain